MSRAPLVMAKPDRAFPRGDQVVYDTTLGWRFPNPRLEQMFARVDGRDGRERRRALGHLARGPGRLALESQRRWAAANDAGRFADELVAVDGLERDEHPRPGTSAEKPATLKPAFREGGGVPPATRAGSAAPPQS